MSSLSKENSDSVSNRPSAQRNEERKYLAKYLLVTISLSLPLLWSFATFRNVYPVAASTMMMGGWHPSRARTYFILRGETFSGETVDINPQELTDALSQQLFGMITATMNNESFKLKRPHPANAAWLESAGGLEGIPRGARTRDLLHAWGKIYNARIPSNSPSRLRALRLDEYRWESGVYANYDRFVQSWREEF